MPRTNINLGGDNAVAVGWRKDAPCAQIGVRRLGDSGEEALFVDFTERGQINSLIATLRRARDGAYGRDE